MKHRTLERRLDKISGSIKPVDVKIPIPQTKADIVKMQVDLMQWNYDRKITAEDYALGNQAIRNLTRLIAPEPQPAGTTEGTAEGTSFQTFMKQLHQYQINKAKVEK
jgi:hypothetical protein